jgi:hypothetical protein
MPHLTSSMMKSGLITLSFKTAWKYQKGDDFRRAEPNFNDSTWHNIAPEGLRANAIPDSLWDGYGWWRIKFTVDSSLYTQISRLHFRAWGAAEVYLDGKNISNYGIFSTQPATEKNYVPRYVLDNAVKITPANVHVLAIRYSNHQGKKNRDLLKHNAPFLGFTIGFANESKAAESERNFAGYVGAHSIITAILLLLMLLHLLLFIKFPKDKSNLAILGVIFLFLMSIATNYVGLLIDITGFNNTIFRGLINSAAFGLGLLLLPYTLSLIFRLDKFNWTKHLVWLAVFRSIIYFIPIFSIIYIDSFCILIIFFAEPV